MVKLIISDIDGCLSPETSEPWDLEGFGKFTRLARAAADNRTTLAPLTLCTGRPQPYVEVLAKLLDIRAPIICENGAVVYSLADNWSRYGPGVTEEKVEGLRAVRRFLDREVVPQYPEAFYQFGKEAMLSVFSKRPSVFPRIQHAVERFVWQHRLPPLVIAPTPFYLNFSMEGVDKGSTVRWLLEELGISREEAAGIGDTMGDYPLRESVGFFACPSNAAQELRESADYVSPYHDLHGVTDILYLPQCQRSF